jgi:hypothetical protein
MLTARVETPFGAADGSSLIISQGTPNGRSVLDVEPTLQR